ncbi:shikimate dehydrogenase family protein [uncultured Megasphaera sp.]|uniref:shikimate dehydrogenase family protein n=1 Tax=Megasphaera massiliensis TaxID=1232428 RepID=UPI00266D4367|nr:shikimate dehydrogenase [uncultured Megasphaera sp.]
MKLGVIGGKLGHTASPAIHDKLFRILQVQGRARYGILEMDRSDISNELKRLRREGYTGANVTIPYKLDVMPYLTDISREARIIGAVNTIHFTDHGTFGYNTDYCGFGRSLVHAGITVKNKDCVVLGSGGGARAIIQYLFDHQAKSIVVVSRNPHSKTEFDEFTERIGVETIDYPAFERSCRGDVLVNCTPVGMFPNIDGCPISEEAIARFPSVVDIVYNPKDTCILQAAKRHGAKTLNGMYMLVAQAIGSEEIWMDQDISSSVIEQIAREMEHYYEK